MGEMKNVVDTFANAGERENVVIMVGGAPVTDDFRKNVGADIYAEDAASAAEAAKQAIIIKKGA
jgi:5-methyltetrahydrofolate--homocysteine methyltransferase